MAMIGSNPDDLDRVSQKMRTSADHLNQVLTRITNDVAQAGWQGPDARRFREAWESQHKPSVGKVAELLVQTGDQLKREASQQREASR